MPVSDWWQGPVKADPDFEQLLKVLRREVPDRPTLFEFFLNGSLDAFMTDIIDDIGYDGKHSYEDAIMPVEEAYDTYGSRIAILGGIDVDYVIRATPEEVYKRSCAMLERASGRGGYALGTGNSVPEYVPAEHYFAMTAAVRRTR
jgi:hypothetical protein